MPITKQVVMIVADGKNSDNINDYTKSPRRKPYPHSPTQEPKKALKPSEKLPDVILLNPTKG